MSKKDRLLLIGSAISVALFPVIVHPIAAISHYVDVMVFAGIFCLVSVGLSLIMGYAGQISLAQAAFFGIGAYTSGILTSKFGFNPWAAMPVGALLAGAVAWIVGMPSLRLKGHYLAMATLGFGVIVSIVFAEEVELTGGPSGLVGIPGLKIAGHALTSEIGWYYLVWSVVFLVLIFCFNIVHSRIGRALRAVHEEERAAESMGVPTADYKVKVFALGAVFAAIGGSLYAHYVTCLNPSSFNLMWSMRFLLMVMAGGMQSLWGAVIGTVLLTFLGNEWLQVFADFEILVYGTILLVVALFLPGGLVSLLHRSSTARERGTLSTAHSVEDSIMKDAAR
jgi:branched-chain amino acid transport system permease protein